MAMEKTTITGVKAQVKKKKIASQVNLAEHWQTKTQEFITVSSPPLPPLQQ